MIIILFSVLLMIFMFSSYSASFHLQIVNRAVVYTPIEIFETSIEVISRQDEDNLYFNKSLLEEMLDNYYERAINNHLSSYTVEKYYYNQADGSICVNNYCNAIEVTVRGRYSYLFTFSRTITYEIHRGEKYGQ